MYVGTYVFLAKVFYQYEYFLKGNFMTARGNWEMANRLLRIIET